MAQIKSGTLNKIQANNNAILNNLYKWCCPNLQFGRQEEMFTFIKLNIRIS
jgi:hypothetical protein